MVDEIIISPPYPPDSSSIIGLRRTLEDLREWVMSMGPWANEVVASYGSDVEIVPAEGLPEVIDLGRYENVALRDVMATFEHVRRLREIWDRQYREFENNYDDKRAVVTRVQCVSYGKWILAEAPILPERREFLQYQHRQELLKMRKTMLEQMGMPEDLARHITGMQMSALGLQADFNEYSNGIDWDDIFYPPEDE